MDLTKAFVDKEVRQLLVGEESDLAEAFTQVEAHLRKRFARGARDRLPGFRPEVFLDDLDRDARLDEPTCEVVTSGVIT